MKKRPNTIAPIDRFKKCHAATAILAMWRRALIDGDRPEDAILASDGALRGAVSAIQSRGLSLWENEGFNVALNGATCGAIRRDVLRFHDDGRDWLVVVFEDLTALVCESVRIDKWRKQILLRFNPRPLKLAARIFHHHPDLAGPWVGSAQASVDALEGHADDHATRIAIRSPDRSATRVTLVALREDHAKDAPSWHSVSSPSFNGMAHAVRTAIGVAALPFMREIRTLPLAAPCEEPLVDWIASAVGERACQIERPWYLPHRSWSDNAAAAAKDALRTATLSMLGRSFVCDGDAVAIAGSEIKLSQLFAGATDGVAFGDNACRPGCVTAVFASLHAKRQNAVLDEILRRTAALLRREGFEIEAMRGMNYEMCGPNAPATFTLARIARCEIEDAVSAHERAGAFVKAAAALRAAPIQVTRTEYNPT